MVEVQRGFVVDPILHFAFHEVLHAVDQAIPLNFDVLQPGHEFVLQPRRDLLVDFQASLQSHLWMLIANHGTNRPVPRRFQRRVRRCRAMTSLRTAS